MTFNELQMLNQGLLADDNAFRQKLTELGVNDVFKHTIFKAQRRLNRAAVNLPDNDTFELAGIYDPKKQHLYLVDKKKDALRLSKLDEIKRLEKTTPLTDTAVEVLEDIDTYNRRKNNFSDNKQDNLGLKRLRDTFNNEVLLQSNMEKYLKKSGALGIFKMHKDELRHIIEHDHFNQSYNDGVKEVTKQTESKKTEPLQLSPFNRTPFRPR